MAKVTIGVTSPHTIPSKFLMPFLGILAYTGKVIGDVNVSISTHYCTYEARNSCVRDTLKNKSDYLFLLDVDILAPSNVIEKLIEKDKDVISGPYHLKEPPYRPLAYKKSDKKGIYDLITDIDEHKLYEVDGIGGGCLLIKREVLEKIGDPCFHFSLDGKDIGEDLYFSHRAKENGFEIWYDNTISDVRHLGASVGFNDFMVWNYHVKKGNVKFKENPQNR